MPLCQSVSCLTGFIFATSFIESRADHGLEIVDNIGVKVDPAVVVSSSEVNADTHRDGQAALLTAGQVSYISLGGPPDSVGIG